KIGGVGSAGRGKQGLGDGRMGRKGGRVKELIEWMQTLDEKRLLLTATNYFFAPKGPPCGVPSSTALTNPFSMTPACRNARISFSMRLSLILSASFAIRRSWFTRSKNFSKSRSTTHR